MKYIQKLLQFNSTLAGHLFLRLFIGLAILTPAGVFLAGYIIDDVNKRTFVRHSHTVGLLLSERFVNTDAQDQAVFTKNLNLAVDLPEISYADIKFKGKTFTPTSSRHKNLKFIEDQTFNQHDDDVYSLSFPLTNLQNGTQATLRLAFDEKVINSAFGSSLNRSIGITYIFLTLAAIVVFLVSRSVSGPIRELTRISKTVASGKFHKTISIDTSIAEVKQLSKDMESMRSTLVNQTNTLDNLSKQDLLTGIPNRRVLDDHLEKAALVAQRTNVPFSVLILDLSLFKEVTESHGLLAGDMIIQEAAARLYGIVRKSDTAARLGGDEFAVLLQATNGQSLEERIKFIANEIKKPYIIYGEAIYVGVNIGVASFPEHGETATDLLRHSDAAKCYSKKNHLDYAFFNSSLSSDNIETLRVQTQLQDFITRNELQVVYQPKIDMATGQIEGFEALARWEHPQEGIIMPDVFIPLCEKSESLINALTLYVTKKACEDAKKWHAAGYAMNVSVNISPKNLLQDNFHHSVVGILETLDFDPGLLELELTETQILAEPLQAIRLLQSLSNEGIQISIDDFGTGYSSLSYLQKLPINNIKIDKSFVMDINGADDNSAIVKATIEMAHNLNLKVIAEGVESEVIANMLKSWKCDSSQGYHYSKPVRFDQTMSILETQAA